MAGLDAGSFTWPRRLAGRPADRGQGPARPGRHPRRRRGLRRPHPARRQRHVGHARPQRRGAASCPSTGRRTIAALSSSYGVRFDPFTRRPAFHSGLDFPGAPTRRSWPPRRAWCPSSACAPATATRSRSTTATASRPATPTCRPLASVPASASAVGQRIGGHGLDRPFDRPASALRGLGQRPGSEPQPFPEGRRVCSASKLRRPDGRTRVRARAMPMAPRPRRRKAPPKAASLISREHHHRRRHHRRGRAADRRRGARRRPRGPPDGRRDRPHRGLDLRRGGRGPRPRHRRDRPPSRSRLYGTAYVDGDITHEQLAMETGAFFQGRSLQFQRPRTVIELGQPARAVPGRPAADRGSAKRGGGLIETRRRSLRGGVRLPAP